MLFCDRLIGVAIAWTKKSRLMKARFIYGFVLSYSWSLELWMLLIKLFSERRFY